TLRSHMPYRTARTECVVHLITLPFLPPATAAQCQALRQEAGRLWTALVALHAQARVQGTWLEAGDLEHATKGGQQPDRAGVVPEVRRQRRCRHRAPAPGGGRDGAAKDGVPPSRHTLPDSQKFAANACSKSAAFRHGLSPGSVLIGQHADLLQALATLVR